MDHGKEAKEKRQGKEAKEKRQEEKGKRDLPQVLPQVEAVLERARELVFKKCGNRVGISPMLS
jgi:hypothetical protein